MENAVNLNDEPMTVELEGEALETLLELQKLWGLETIDETLDKFLTAAFTHPDYDPEKVAASLKKPD